MLATASPLATAIAGTSRLAAFGSTWDDSRAAQAAMSSETDGARYTERVPRPMQPAKLRRLRSISTPRGVIAAVAMDQRRSLRRMLAATAGAPDESISDAALADFKAAVTTALTPH